MSRPEAIARKELHEANTELESFKATSLVPSYFDGNAREYLSFLVKQVEDRQAELKDKEAELTALENASQKSATKKIQYRGNIKVETSCVKFLDALAKKVYELYEFETIYERTPTMGDVLKAKDGIQGPDWQYRVHGIKQKQTLTSIPLPDLYSEEDWDFLSSLNQMTALRIYNGRMPTTTQGKPFIILPHSDYHDARVNQLKQIAVTAELVYLTLS